MKNPSLAILPSQEETILEGLQQGEESAYQALFEEYYTVLTTFAYQYVHDLDAAKELVQEVFITLYQKRASIRIEKSLKSYLFQAVYRRFLNTHTQQERRDFYHNEVAREQDFSDCTDAMEQAEALQRIHRAIDQLPDQCRRIFTMNRFDGMNNQAIADQLHLSKRTVETQISKALKLLRQSLLPQTLILLLLEWVM
ncbi:RNA polymerase sigma-70 factor [Tunicatimonas pelagia]|uniref:RNA polymerase sigma-70 factor n=1 Tax=Tunicatimonas pelagia TaxID=931531 RepID=UPI0026660531|nr:RNA polymerase sigma-70 factor [Tunicatimonas pelagia]WKN43145.1 RNA polymerase sigma-70 factor [Tunicatimonas pelagia]